MADKQPEQNEEKAPQTLEQAAAAHKADVAKTEAPVEDVADAPDVDAEAPAEDAVPDDAAPEAEPADDAPDEAAEAVQDEEAPEEMSPDELDDARANEVAFSWQASEYVHHHKGPGWYAALAGGVVVMVGLAALLHFWLEIGMFMAAGAAVMVYAKKAPRTLMYELTPKGVVIEGKERPFTEFRSFGVVKDEEWHTIDLEPMKRWAPRLAILFDSDDFDDIVGHLELHLPRADRDPDPIEKLSRYLRF